MSKKNCTWEKKNKKPAGRAANSPQRSRESFWEGLSRAGDLGKASRKAKRALKGHETCWGKVEGKRSPWSILGREMFSCRMKGEDVRAVPEARLGSRLGEMSASEAL